MSDEFDIGGQSDVLTFIVEESVHVTDVDKILLVLARDTDGELPLVDKLQNLGVDGRGKDRRAFGEPFYEFVQELFGSDLQVEWVAAVLDENIE